MTCQLIRTPDMTLWEAKELAGFEHGYGVTERDKWKQVNGRLVRKTASEIQAEQERVERETVLHGGLVMFCGSGDPEPLCECMALATLLCDYPIGRGKTCSLPMCSEHAHEVGEDRHLCIIHLAEFKGKTGTSHVGQRGLKVIR